MMLMSKSAPDTWYAERLPARLFIASLSTSASNGRSGSTGNGVPLGGEPVCIFFSASAITVRASSILTERYVPELAAELSSPGVVIATTSPAALKSGAPRLSPSSCTSARSVCVLILLTCPDVSVFWSCIGVLIAKTASFSAIDAFSPCGYPSFTGRADATAFGSIQRIATSFVASATSTRAASFTVGENWISTDAALPTRCWFVATSPRASIRNPDPCAVWLQIETTLFCQSMRRPDVSASSRAAADVSADAAADADADAASTCALPAVSSRTVSRPAGTSKVWTHW